MTQAQTAEACFSWMLKAPSRRFRWSTISCFPTRALTLNGFSRCTAATRALRAILRCWLKRMALKRTRLLLRFLNPEYWDEAIPYLNWLMDRDRKSTALKSLQGRIWKGGFEADELKGTLFDDVPAALERWSTAAQVAIYSSGSVAAQLLLFRHSSFGDLTPLISGYFDTRTGPKTSSASYESIASAMGCEPREIMFFSDVVRELDPAREAGCHTRLVMREGNAPVDDAHGHRRIKSFNVL